VSASCDHVVVPKIAVADLRRFASDIIASVGTIPAADAASPEEPIER
jgi:hypothetical protein